MNLIIVESPTKAKTLSRFLGKDYEVEATMGHIKDLPKSKISVDVENNFKPDYQPVEAKAKSIDAIVKAAKNVSGVYIATDPDREGEAIAQHVLEILKESKLNKLKDSDIKRITFHEITKSAVEESMSHPGKVDKHRVDAQIARRVLDRLVGYKLSPLLWKKVRRGLSAGRVQTVTVRLIVEKEREIKAFKPDEYWEVFCLVKSAKIKNKNEFLIKLAKIGGKTAKVTDGKTAKKVVGDLEKSVYKVEEVRSKEVRKNPFPPFTTSTMTQSCARLMGWSAKRTMSVAQKLYEEGFITYHRTDSTSIAESALTKTRSYIKKEFGKEYLPDKPNFYKTKSKSAQEAHESIRPTNVKVGPNSEIKVPRSQGHHAKLYKLIWARFVACQMNPAIYDETRIDVAAMLSTANSLQSTAESNTENINSKAGRRKSVTDDYTLRVSGQVMKFDGWKKVIPPGKNDEQQLPKVEKDDALDLLKVDPQQKFTKPPARYNEASLIKKLESLGIGRPSTYAPTITTIQFRNYVEKDEGKFQPTNVGIAVNDYLMKNFPSVFDYQFTAEMEDDLDNVAKGERKWQEMMKEFYKPFEKKVKHSEEKSKRVKIETEKIGKKCPTCKEEGRTGKKQGELVIRIGRFGKFISCEHFPDCKHTEKFENRAGMKCPDCKKGHVIIKKTRRGRKFFGCSRYPDCEFASWTKPGTEDKDESKDKKS